VEAEEKVENQREASKRQWFTELEILSKELRKQL